MKRISLVICIIMLTLIINACSNNKNVDTDQLIKKEQTKNVSEIESNQSASSQNSVTLVLAIIDYKFYQSIETELNQWELDLNNENFTVERLIADQDISLQDIRNNISDRYKRGLDYAVFIGDIPYTYDNDATGWTEKKTISEKYFADVNTEYNLNTNLFSKKEGPHTVASEFFDIVVGRILPPTSYPLEQRKNMLKEYFEKIHKYRIGQIQFDKKIFMMNGMSLYSDAEIQNSKKSFISDNSLYDNETQIEVVKGSDAQSLIQSYLNALQRPYEFMIVNIHGGEDYQYTDANIPINKKDFVDPWECARLKIPCDTSQNEKYNDANKINYDQFKNISPKTGFIMLFSCNNGDISHPHYLAGELLFNGDILQVYAHTTPVGIISQSQMTGGEITEFTGPKKIFFNYLSNGGVIAQYQKVHDFMVLGDPTLSIRKRKDVHSFLTVSPNPVDMGLVKLNQEIKTGIKPEKKVLFRNTGKDPIKFSKTSSRFDDIKNIPPQITPENPAMIVDENKVLTPEQSYETYVFFDYDQKELIGKNVSGVFQIMTNNNQKPFYYIQVKAIRGNEFNSSS